MYVTSGRPAMTSRLKARPHQYCRPSAMVKIQASLLVCGSYNRYVADELALCFVIKTFQENLRWKVKLTTSSMIFSIHSFLIVFVHNFELFRNWELPASRFTSGTNMSGSSSMKKGTWDHFLMGLKEASSLYCHMTPSLPRAYPSRRGPDLYISLMPILLPHWGLPQCRLPGHGGYRAQMHSDHKS